MESAYILTPKTDLPKVTRTIPGVYVVEGVGPLASIRSTAEEARKYANAWLAIAKHLEREEAARVYEEAKAKAVAEAAAAAAKQARLDELADEWFGKDYTDLGPNKAAAIQEIHRLETQLNTKDAA